MQKGEQTRHTLQFLIGLAAHFTIRIVNKN